MKYKIHTFLDTQSVNSAWRHYDGMLQNEDGVPVWMPDRVPESKCVARARETGKWWLCKFNMNGHVPHTGPFDSWEQALATLKLIA